MAAPRAAEAGLPLLLAGLALCFAAADGALLLCGLGFVLLVAGWRDGPGALPSPVAAAGLLCLGAAFGLLGGAATEFATLRAVPPDGWRAAAVPFLGLAGAGAVATAALPPDAAPPAPSRRAEDPLLAAGLPVAAIYVLARLLPDLGGPAQPSWWGLPLLACGGAGAVAAALRAVSAEEVERVPVFAGAAAAGLAAMALGAALVFRGADLGALAALAAGGALLLVLGSGLGLGALAIVAGGRGAVGRERAARPVGRAGAVDAGRRRCGAAGRGELGAPAAPARLRRGVGAVAGAGRGMAAGRRRLAAVLRRGACVGRRGGGDRGGGDAAGLRRRFSRPPAHAARRRGAGRGGRHPLGDAGSGCAAAAFSAWCRAGCWPEGGRRSPLLVGRAPLPTRGAGLALAEGGAAYAPLLLAALLALLVLALAALVLRLAPAAGVARGPAWDGGFLSPPPHLPFGDPLTQPSAAGLAEPLRRMLGASGAETPPPSPPRRSFAGFYDGAPFAVLLRGTAGAALGGGLLVLAVALAALVLAGAG